MLLKELYRRVRFGAPIVIVSGLPRSGTSMMMKMLSAGGMELSTDEVRSADEDNPLGYFEDERVKQLDKAADKSWIHAQRGRAIKVISFLLQELPAGCRYKVLFMRRDLEEVVASQNKMLSRRGESDPGAADEKMIEIYARHLRKVEFLMADRPDIDHLDVSYNEALEQPGEIARRVARFLNLALDVEAMASAVDGSLYRNRRP
jgi:hypothetical protein